MSDTPSSSISQPRDLAIAKLALDAIGAKAIARQLHLTVNQVRWSLQKHGISIREIKRERSEFSKRWEHLGPVMLAEFRSTLAAFGNRPMSGPPCKIGPLPEIKLATPSGTVYRGTTE